jgi:1-acyl-sn-glycerol-3-phosphate acyltransferase
MVASSVANSLIAALRQVPTALRHALFWLAVAVLTACYCVLLPVMALPRRFLLSVVKSYLAVVLLLFQGVLGIRWQVVGNADAASGPVLVAAKHQSAFETLVLQYVLNDPVIVLKRELLQLPLFGWVLRRLGHIGVDREGGLEAARALRSEALKAHAQERPIVIFPEGSRLPVGRQANYKSGVDLLYRMLKCTCVPVAVNSGKVWPTTARLPRPGNIVMEFLPSIESDLSRADFAKRLENDIESATERLLQPGACQPDGSRC